jgi:hypothetical protein
VASTIYFENHHGTQKSPQKPSAGSTQPSFSAAQFSLSSCAGIVFDICVPSHLEDGLNDGRVVRLTNIHLRFPLLEISKMSFTAPHPKQVLVKPSPDGEELVSVPRGILGLPGGLASSSTLKATPDVRYDQVRKVLHIAMKRPDRGTSILLARRSNHGFLWIKWDHSAIFRHTRQAPPNLLSLECTLTSYPRRNPTELEDI